jgi:hypothetical protein
VRRAQDGSRVCGYLCLGRVRAQLSFAPFKIHARPLSDRLHHLPSRERPETSVPGKALPDRQDLCLALCSARLGHPEAEQARELGCRSRG